MSAAKPPFAAADVCAATTRIRALLAAADTQAKAKRIDWGRLFDILRVAGDEIRDMTSPIIDFHVAQLSENREDSR